MIKGELIMNTRRMGWVLLALVFFVNAADGVPTVKPDRCCIGRLAGGGG